MKKWISAGLAVIMSVGMLAGCGKEEVVIDNGGAYAPQKDLKLTIWNAQGTEHVQQDTSKENIPLTWLESKTKVEVENVYGNDGGQWDTKLSRLIAGDNMPDIFYVAGGQGPAHFKKIQSAKKMYPLTKELIQEYAPNVWKRVPAEYWDMLTSNGEIMGIPFGFNVYDKTTHPDATDEQLEYMNRQFVGVTSNQMPLYIRDDISKKLFPDSMTFEEMCAIIDETQQPIGEKYLDIPINSTEDYIKMFRDIAAMNLTENGKKVFAFGYNGGDLWVPLTYLGASMYGYATNNYISHWDPIKKEIITPLTEDLIKDAAKIQNKLIREGVFDPESLVQTNAVFKQNCLNGLYAVTCLDYCGGMISINNQLEKLGKSYRYRPLTSNVPQNEHYPIQYYTAPWTAAVCLTDNLDDEDVKQVLNWINVMFSDEFEETLWWGRPEDGLYKEENGVRKYVDDRFNKRYIGGESSVLPVAECKGIGSAVYSPECEFYMLVGFSPTKSRWNPRCMQNITAVTSAMGDGFRLTEKVEGTVMRPQSNVYDAPYAEVAECVEFWAAREQWEAPFKIALGADSDESFEKQWNDAVKNFNSITDIPKMREGMTRIAKEQAKALGIE